MANPRKFSEKIALHNQKQAEETAEFERIMREVSDVTSKVGPLVPGFPPAGSCVNECECDSKKKRNGSAFPRENLYITSSGWSGQGQGCCCYRGHMNFFLLVPWPRGLRQSTREVKLHDDD